MASFQKGKFYQMNRGEARLSSRFASIPCCLERDEDDEASGNRSRYHPIQNSSTSPQAARRLFEGAALAGGPSPQPALQPAMSLPPQPISAQAHSIGQLLSLVENNQLSVEKLQLGADQEKELLAVLSRSATALHLNQLKALYLKLKEFDPHLSGLIDIATLNSVFAEFKLPIPAALTRLLFLFFLSNEKWRMVEYEKLLSFINSSINLRREAGPMRNVAREIYYENEREMGGGGGAASRSVDIGQNEETRLIKLLQEEARDLRMSLSLEKLRAAMQRADNLMRGALSKKQLIQLCHENGFNFDEALLELVVHRCRERGGGQHDWEQFMGFMSKIAFSLATPRIPKSQSPIDHQIAMPQPSPNWPRSDIKMTQELVAPSLPPAAPANHSELNSTYSSSYGGLPPRNDMEAQQPLQQASGGAIEGRAESLKYQQKSAEIKDVPWFDRFMKLANMLYETDSQCSGYLEVALLKKLTAECDKFYELNLTGADIDAAAFSHLKPGNLVDIGAFLKYLATSH